MRTAGFELVNADCVLIGERPRIADRPRRDGRAARRRDGRGHRPRHGAGDDHRRARLHRPRRGARRPGCRAAPNDVKARPLRRPARTCGEIRSRPARGAPSRVHAPQRARAADTGAGCTRSIRTSSSRLLDGEELVAELHSVPDAWDGTADDLPAGWDDAFTRAFESGREPTVLCALAISVLARASAASGSRAGC